MRSFLLMVVLLYSAFAGYSQRSFDFAGFPVNNGKYHRSAPQTEWKCDSGDVFKWQTASSEWSKLYKEYMLYDDHKNITENLFLQIHPVTTEWVNMGKETREYFQDYELMRKRLQDWDITDEIWVETELEEYDNQGRETLDMELDYDAATNTFTSGSKYVYTYSAGITERLLQNYEEVTQQWVNVNKHISNYENNLLQSYLTVMWVPGTSSWQNYSRDDYYYTSGLKSEKITYFWDAGTSNWRPDRKTAWGYNQAGKEITYNTYNWNSSTSGFDNDERTITNYDPQTGEMTDQYEEEWDVTMQTWVPYSKTVCTYHPNGQLLEKVSTFYNPNTAEYLDWGYEEYDAEGKMLEEYMFMYNNNYQISLGLRWVYFYQGNIETGVTSQNWTGSGWRDEIRFTYTLDGNGNVTQRLMESYDDVQAMLVNVLKEDYFYSEFIGIRELPDLMDLCIFRNPLRPGDEIRCSSLKEDKIYSYSLYSMNGAVVSTGTLGGTSSFSIPAGLSEGQYLLTVTDNGKNLVAGKVTVSR